jgi:hypothetical protein
VSGRVQRVCTSSVTVFVSKLKYHQADLVKHACNAENPPAKVPGRECRGPRDGVTACGHTHTYYSTSSSISPACRPRTSRKRRPLVESEQAANIAKSPRAKKPRVSRKRAEPLAPQLEPAVARQLASELESDEYDFETRHNKAWDGKVEPEKAPEHLQNVTDFNPELPKQSYAPLDVEDKLHTRQIHLPEGFFDQEPLCGCFACFCENPEPCASCSIDSHLDLEGD